MNCDTARPLLLLRDSGELSARQTPVLSSHLEQCPACRAYQADLAWLRQALVSFPAAAPCPSREVMAVIKASSRATPPVLHGSLVPYWKTVLAAAAGLMLCIAGLRLLAPGRGGNAYPVATEILPLAALILGGDEYVEPSSGTSDTAVLADQLLILQGMKTELSDDAADEVMPPEDTLPTTLQWNNTPESRRGICG